MKELPVLAVLVALAVAWAANAAPDVEPMTFVDLRDKLDSRDRADSRDRLDARDRLSEEKDAIALRQGAAVAVPRENEVGAPRLLYPATGLDGDRRFMHIFGAKRHRVKIRAVESVFGNHAPVFYPAMHWIPAPMLEQELREPDSRYSEEQFFAMGRDTGEHAHQAFYLMAMLNVRLFPGLANEGRCCAPNAELVIELAVDFDELEPRLLRFDMTETDPGVYYVDDPADAAFAIVSEVVSFGDRPLMTVVALEGTGFRPKFPTSGIPYVVRWGTLDLEYGSHILRDPEGVIR